MQEGRGAALVRATRLWAAVIAAAVIGLDHLTKLLVVRAVPEGESRPVIDGILSISHFRNSGAAFGMLRGFTGILALVALVGVVIFAAIVVRDPSRGTAIGAALVAGGASGNLLDRFFRPGGVVDFVDFGFWPAFNVADSAITIGAVIILLTGLRERKDEPAGV